MPSGGWRPNSGRKPGFLGKINSAAREQALELIGSADDPVRLALAYAKDPNWPATLRTQLVLGLMSVTYPRLVAQTVESRSIQLRVGAEALAAKTALLLERGPAERPNYDTELEEGDATEEVEPEETEAGGGMLAEVLAEGAE